MFDLDPDFNRLRTTLLGGEPDRVPAVEIHVDREIKEAFLGRRIQSTADDVEFWYRAGYDYVHIRAGYEYRMLGDEASVSKALYGGDLQTFGWVSTRDTWINDWAQYETYPWPDPATIDYSPIQQAARSLPQGMQVISGVGGIFTRVWRIMGYENFSYALVDKPDLVAALFRRVGETQLAVFQHIVEMDGVGAMWYGDDMAYNTGLMVSPQVLRRHVFPYLKEMGRICRRKDLPFILHSDGDLRSIVGDLLDIGFHAIHPVEPATWNLIEVKAELGRRLCLLGTVDLSDVLTRGTPETVDAAVRECIRIAAPGGGYGIGSSNSITHYVPMANFNALRDATCRWGRYPIQV